MMSPESLAAADGNIVRWFEQDFGGTVVELTVIPTVPAAAGVVRMEPGPIEIPLEVPEAPGDSPTGAGAEVLTATLRLSESGSYRVALAGPDGNLRTASRDYLIEVLEDLPPIVRFVRPGRDTQANPVEEVFTEVLAEDDYALRRVEMRVSINGGEETREVLASGGARDEIQSGHTLFLEEHDLVPGDLVSYYAVARDGAGAEAATDIFFIAVRPFDRTYRQGETMPGAGAGGGGDGLDGTLSLRQKQIVVATFKVLRDRDGMPASAVTETVATIGLAQGRLREQVATLNRRLRNRGIGATPEFSEIVEHLDAGLVEMTVAEELLSARVDVGAVQEERPRPGGGLVESREGALTAPLGPMPSRQLPTATYQPAGRQRQSHRSGVSGTRVTSLWRKAEVPVRVMRKRAPQWGSGQAISASEVIQSLGWVRRCLAGSRGRSAARG